jgi:hypothetical protein
MHQAGIEGMHGGFKIMMSSKITQPFFEAAPFLSSLTGLKTFPDPEPSHKWLGYFQGERE